MELPSIAEFYRNRCVLVTGGTGFMGKVLVEKLLRSCPDIETIYLLARAKSGAKIQDRIQEVIGTQVKVFRPSRSPWRPSLFYVGLFIFGLT
jgi:fatty acyl-CoA reductase